MAHHKRGKPANKRASAKFKPWKVGEAKENYLQGKGSKQYKIVKADQKEQ